MITTILVFGFEKKEIQKIESLFSEFDILDVGCSTDLIALPACAIIISGSSFEKEYLWLHRLKGLHYHCVQVRLSAFSPDVSHIGNVEGNSA